jgi:hypothetical protein
MARLVVTSRAVGALSLALLCALALAYACGSSLPTPRTGPHPATGTNYIEVPYPPPAAQVEIIPPKPREGAVWVDGEWAWEGNRWVWESGGWVAPPEHAYLAPWLTYRQANGKLLFASGTWHLDTGAPLPKPVVLAAAETSLDPQRIDESDAAPAALPPEPDSGAYTAADAPLE